jgi:hypothetical protein
MSRVSRLKKFVLTAVAGALATVGTVALIPGSAHAAGLFTVRLAPSSNPFLFVEVAGASTAATATIDQWSYTGGDNQVWTFLPTAGLYEIINQHSGKCIWTDGVAGKQLIQAPCTGSRFELWSIGAQWINGDFTYDCAISNPASGRYMDVQGDSRAQGGAIDVWTRNYADNQYFHAYRA